MAIVANPGRVPSDPLPNRFNLSLKEAKGHSPQIENPEEAKKWKASLEFEAMFLGEMYKSMRKTVGHNEVTEPSFARETFMEMQDHEIASANLKSPLQSGPMGLESAMNGTSHSLAARIYRSLSTVLSSQVTADATNPSLQIPISKMEMNAIITEASNQHGVDANLIRSVIHVESGNKAKAFSSKGAKGLMQLMDSTAAEMGVKNSWDPRENIMGGTKYLRLLQDRFQGDLIKTLAGYNAGPAAVDRHGGIPPFPETQDYVKKVLRFRDGLNSQMNPKE